MIRDSVLDFDAIDIRRLSTEDDISEWRCGDDDWASEVSDFLHEDAVNQQQQGLSVTLVFRHDGRIAGFASLLGGTLRREDDPDLADGLNVGYDEFPCLKIGQFGVHSDYQGTGLGNYMMEWLRIEARSLHVGFRFLSLHVRNDNRRGRAFWNRHGFWPIVLKSGSRYQFMVYDLYASA